MSNNANYVSVGKPAADAAIFWAPKGTTLPTTASATLNSAFVCLGYASDDGVVNAKSRETTEIKAWGGDTVASPQTGKTDQLKMKLIESLNKNVLSVVHGSSNVSGTLESGLTIHENSKELDHGCWVIDTVLTGNAMRRIVVPDGKITEIGDVAYKDNEVIGYDITVTCYPSSALDGDTHVEYITGPTGATGATGA